MGYISGVGSFASILEGGVLYKIIWNFAAQEACLSPPFIHLLVMYLYWSGFMDIYTLGYNSIIYFV